jgi:membrane fusion protein (multidrug efflux system)
MTPVQGAAISAQESGPVVDLIAAKGSPVTKGQGLVELERSILKSEMEAAASNLEAQAYNLDKVQQLFAAGKISKIELLETRATHDGVRAQAEITAERYRRALIRAPFAGVVADRYVELGEMVMPGQAVIRVIDPYVLKLEGYLTGPQVAYAKVGNPAAVRLGFEGLEAQGAISWVSPEADRMTGKFKVEVEVPNPDLTLRSGVIGRAQISKNILRDVITVPRDALMEGRHGLEIFVVENDRAYRRSVKSGRDQGTMVEVSGEVQPGDLLVVRGHRDLVEGALVSIIEEADAPDGSNSTDPEAVRTVETGAAQ